VRDPELRDMWRLMVARSAACPVSMLVRWGTWSTGYRHNYTEIHTL
jgi:hypothetical protein